MRVMGKAKTNKKVTAQETSPASVWMVSREYGELAGAGGVKDVTKQLARALADTGREVSVVLPLYGFIDPQAHDLEPLELAFEIDMNYLQEERRETVKVWSMGRQPAVYLLDSPRFREKDGIYTYTEAEEATNPECRQGEGHIDYFAMNVLLQKATLALIVRLGQKPEIIHCHDGHTALLPVLFREIEGWRDYFTPTAAVVTIHNAGVGYHQEIGDLAFAKAITGLPAQVLNRHLLDGKFDPLLAAASYAEVNTVSENYARELRETIDDEQTGWLGHRLMARGLRLAGITNGIDPSEYSPAQPGYHKLLGLPCGYTPGEKDAPCPSGRPGPAGKSKCHADLLRALASKTLNITQSGSLTYRPLDPLFTFIGRLSAQKGVDILVAALRQMLAEDDDFQALILGTGPEEIEAELAALADHPDYTGRICFLRCYNPQLALRVYAAGDFFVIPSVYEPCGLTDFIAQLFGNLPIVHRVGGLVKVLDQQTGFAYEKHSPTALLVTMRRAKEIFHNAPETILAMQKEAITLIEQKYTWETVVARYLELYRESLAKRKL